MDSTTIYKDNFETTFQTQQEFLTFLDEREVNTIWKKAMTKELSFIAVDGSGSAELSNDIISDFENNGQRPVLEDTIRNTCLLLRQEEKLYPIRNCAVKTVLERAKEDVS